MWQQGRRHQRIAMVNVGPDRRQQIQDTLKALDPACAQWVEKDNVLKVYPLAQQTRFRYETPVPFQIGRIPLHPLYEGKAFSWFRNSVPIDASGLLFWLTGPPLAQSFLEGSSDG
jgi:hypothetical protein